MDFVLLKYTIILLNLLLFSQAQLETTSKLQVLACSKILNQKFKEKPESEILSKMMLSCFMKISQSQAQKIFNSLEKGSFPLKQEEIDELIDTKNLEENSEEELKYKSSLLNKYIQEIESPKDNIRKLEELDNNATEADNDVKDPINNEETKNSDDLNDIDNNDMDDGMGDFNDTNYYGDDDMNYEGGMYDDDYYDDYYDDDYWRNGNYDYGNMSDEDYSKMYGNDYSNDYGYNYNENQTYKEWIMENKFAAIFIVCLVIMVILIAIFGKDYEETQTLEIDPNKNKNE